jgi:DNA-binding NarL/FixJ family response regulator
VFDHNLNLSEKKILVIDDFAEFRFAVRKMLEQMKGKHIDMAANGERAVELMQSTRYDIVLSDYNLGEAKDGQQILEEGRVKGFVGHSTIFVLVTAENTTDMVYGALEYSPDAYLTKPFTRDFLSQRLSKLLAKKRFLQPAERALDARKYQQADKETDALLAKKSKYGVDVLRIKAMALMGLKNYAKAGQVYSLIASQKKMPWAILGLGRAKFHQGQYQEAADTFRSLIQANAAFVEAYDWLAKCLVELRQPSDALATLKSAIERSPKAILRQQQAARLALSLDETEFAEKCARMAVRLGRYSVFQDKEDYTLHAKLLLEKGKRADANTQAKRSWNEALGVLKEAREKYRDRFPDFLVRIAALEGVLQAKVSASNPAEAMKKLRKVIDQMPDTMPLRPMCDTTRELVAGGEEEFGLVLAGGILSKKPDDDALIEELKAIFEGSGFEEHFEQVVSEEKVKFNQDNRSGMMCYEKGQYQEASAYFEKALKELPTNVAINLNYAQCLIAWMEKGGGKDNKARAKQCLAEIAKHVEDNGARKERFDNLDQRLQALE